MTFLTLGLALLAAGIAVAAKALRRDIEVVKAFWLLASALWVDRAAALVLRLSMGNSGCEGGRDAL